MPANLNSLLAALAAPYNVDRTAMPTPMPLVDPGYQNASVQGQSGPSPSSGFALGAPPPGAADMKTLFQLWLQKALGGATRSVDDGGNQMPSGAPGGGAGTGSQSNQYPPTSEGRSPIAENELRQEAMAGGSSGDSDLPAGLATRGRSPQEVMQLYRMMLRLRGRDNPQTSEPPMSPVSDAGGDSQPAQQLQGGGSTVATNQSSQFPWWLMINRPGQ